MFPGFAQVYKDTQTLPQYAIWYRHSPYCWCTHCSNITVKTPDGQKLRIPVGSAETFADVATMLRKKLCIPETSELAFQPSTASQGKRDLIRLSRRISKWCTIEVVQHCRTRCFEALVINKSSASTATAISVQFMTSGERNLVLMWLPPLALATTRQGAILQVVKHGEISKVKSYDKHSWSVATMDNKLVRYITLDANNGLNQVIDIETGTVTGGQQP